MWTVRGRNPSTDRPVPASGSRCAASRRRPTLGALTFTKAGWPMSLKTGTKAIGELKRRLAPASGDAADVEDSPGMGLKDLVGFTVTDPLHWIWKSPEAGESGPAGADL